METVHFFIAHLSLSLGTKCLFFCISGVPVNDLTPIKLSSGMQGRSIISRCTMHCLEVCMQISSCRGSYFQCCAPCERYFVIK